MNEKKIKDEVKKRYSKIAEGAVWHDSEKNT